MKQYTTPGWVAVGVLALIATLKFPLISIVAAVAMAVIVHAWYWSLQ